MEKRTIAQVAIEVLKEAEEPMTAVEITQVILDKELYSFNTKEPKSIVRNALERHCEGVNRRNSATEKLFKKHSDGKYTIK
jgi:hypothetical protein